MRGDAPSIGRTKKNNDGGGTAVGGMGEGEGRK